MPLVSIIMPIHNAAPFLQEAIDSIHAQTYQGPKELLVFDDGPSNDQSRDILEANRSVLAARGIALKIVDERTDAAARKERKDAAARSEWSDAPVLTEQTHAAALEICYRSKDGLGNGRQTDSGSFGDNGGCGGVGDNNRNGGDEGVGDNNRNGGDEGVGGSSRGIPEASRIPDSRSNAEAVGSSERGQQRTQPRGCGFGRNRAIEHSRGEFLCFADGDDVMAPDRISLQLALASQSHKLLLQLTQQLYLQQLVETTLIAPTWFCPGQVFDALGPFDESGQGTPDDLMFFYQHLGNGGWLGKVSVSTGPFDESGPSTPDDLMLFHQHLSNRGFLGKVPWMRAAGHTRQERKNWSRQMAVIRVAGHTRRPHVLPPALAQRGLAGQGPFDESGPGTPGGLVFFHQHMRNKGCLGKMGITIRLACKGASAASDVSLPHSISDRLVPQPLVTYRFHSASVTGSRGCPWESIWEQRVNQLEARLLSGYDDFDSRSSIEMS
ncbi:unnamed protein product [Closterium sp. NIES-64]|nr:unnamed protein product [Closterium sp. NIES-64]